MDKLPFFSLKKFSSLYKKSLKTSYSDELLVYFIYRPVSYIFAYIFYHTPVIPNVITVIRAVSGLIAGCLIGFGQQEYIFIGAILLLFSNICDTTDGQLARMKEKFSDFGTVLDGISDTITVISVYSGVAMALSRTSPQIGNFYWLFMLIGGVSFIIHLSTFGYLRHEYTYYSIPNYPKYIDTKENVLKKIDSLGNNSEQLRKKFALYAILIFNVVPMEAVMKIIFPGSYNGYQRWYSKNNGIPEHVKASFKNNYTRFNKFLLAGFGFFGMISNLTVFVITGLLNCLEVGVFLICIVFNVVYIIISVLQHLSLKTQLEIAGSRAINN